MSKLSIRGYFVTNATDRFHTNTTLSGISSNVAFLLSYWWHMISSNATLFLKNPCLKYLFLMAFVFLLSSHALPNTCSYKFLKATATWISDGWTSMFGGSQILSDCALWTALMWLGWHPHCFPRLSSSSSKFLCCILLFKVGACLCTTMNQRITECFLLEGTFKSHLVQCPAVSRNTFN